MQIKTFTAMVVVGLLGSVAAQAAVGETDRQYCERQEGIAREVCLRELDRAAREPARAKPPSEVRSSPSAAPVARAGNGGAPPYQVSGGFHVDAATFKGFQTWRAAACDRRHGASQQGLVGPSLIESLKTLPKSDFEATLRKGRLEKGMPSFGENTTVMSNLDNLWAYLKGRSDGAITQAHVDTQR